MRRPTPHPHACVSRPAASLNLVAPFSCDVTSPTSFLILKRAPDIEALKAAKQAERKKQRQLEEEESTVTYKVVKQGR